MAEPIPFPMQPEVFVGDCLVWLSGLQSDSVDLIVTDPPYGIGYEKGGQPTTGRNSNQVNWSPILGDDRVDGRWLIEAFRVLRPGSALYMCCRWDVEPEWRLLAKAAGFLVKQRLTWHKRVNNKGDLKGTWAGTCEDVLFLTKGRHILNNRPSMLLDVGCVPTWERRYHPHQKPVKLMQALIENSSRVMDLVVDPFLGCGTTGLAAKYTNRRFMGCEVDESMAELAYKRLTE